MGLDEVNRRRKINLASSKKYEEDSKKRLGKILRKKLTTCFIGCIAEIENSIGKFLWGHGKPASECNKNELIWRKTWEKCRNAILNHGNNQIRGTESELEEYEVRWNRHTTTFKVNTEKK